MKFSAEARSLSGVFGQRWNSKKRLVNINLVRNGLQMVPDVAVEGGIGQGVADDFDALGAVESGANIV